VLARLKSITEACNVALEACANTRENMARAARQNRIEIPLCRAARIVPSGAVEC